MYIYRFITYSQIYTGYSKPFKTNKQWSQLQTRINPIIQPSNPTPNPIKIDINHKKRMRIKLEAIKTHQDVMADVKLQLYTGIKGTIV